jgi:hypothetical protein
MKKLTFAALAAVMALGVASCTSTEQRAGGGALLIGGGAALATAALGGNSAQVATAALIGGTVGAVLGVVTERPGYCRFQGRKGTTYIDKCPPRY